MKRIVLFLLTNLAVMVVISVVIRVLGLDRALAQDGIDVGALLAFSAVVGFTGAIISLLMSKPIAKWSTGATVIESPRNETESWLIATVRKLAEKASVGMPEVAVYEGEPNAFATGAFRNSALVAVSTGLLTAMSRAEAGSARYLGSPQPMVRALAQLGGLPPGELPKSLNGFGITDRSAVMALFATHPPIEARIAALQGRT